MGWGIKTCPTRRLEMSNNKKKKECQKKDKYDSAYISINEKIYASIQMLLRKEKKDFALILDVL